MQFFCFPPQSFHYPGLQLITKFKNSFWRVSVRSQVTAEKAPTLCSLPPQGISCLLLGYTFLFPLLQLPHWSQQSLPDGICCRIIHSVWPALTNRMTPSATSGKAQNGPICYLLARLISLHYSWGKGVGSVLEGCNRKVTRNFTAFSWGPRCYEAPLSF